MELTTAPRDNQRNAVYLWETKLAKQLGLSHWGETLTGGEIEDAVNIMLMHHNLGMVEIRYTDRMQEKAYAQIDAITFGAQARTPMTVCHETAHVISGTKCGWDKIAGHGPEFASVFVDLLERYMDVDSTAAKKLGAMTKPRKVHFAKKADTPQFSYDYATDKVKAIFAAANARHAQVEAEAKRRPTADAIDGMVTELIQVERDVATIEALQGRNELRTPFGESAQRLNNLWERRTNQAYKLKQSAEWRHLTDTERREMAATIASVRSDVNEFAAGMTDTLDAWLEKADTAKRTPKLPNLS